jgi:hypothetical protein
METSFSTFFVEGFAEDVLEVLGEDLLFWEVLPLPGTARFVATDGDSS